MLFGDVIQEPAPMTNTERAIPEDGPSASSTKKEEVTRFFNICDSDITI